MRELHKKVLTVFTTAEVETRFPNILLEGGALSVVENPIRTCSPYPSPANNKAGQLRDGRVVDLVLPINLPLRALPRRRRGVGRGKHHDVAEQP